MQTLHRLFSSFHNESPCFDMHSAGEETALMSCDGDLGDLECLPPEMQLYILSFFSIKELVPIFRVSKKMNFLASCNYLWLRFVEEEVIGFVQPEPNAGDSTLPNKELYRLFATVWRWDNKPDKKATAIELGDGGRTAFRASQKGTNPAVLATMPFSKRRNSFEVKVNARGSWIGIGVADRKYRIIDGSTLGKQRQGINSAFFCQDTTVLQMEGARRTHVEKTISHRIDVGDRIRVKLDLATNSIAYYRNGLHVGTLRSEKPLADIDLYPCVNLSQGSSLTLVNSNTDAPQEYVLKYGRLPPVN